MVLKVVAVQRDEGDEEVDCDGWRCSSEEDEGEAAWTGEKKAQQQGKEKNFAPEREKK